MPVEHLQWMLDHAEYHEYEDGTVIVKTGEVAEYMILIIEGVLSFYMNKSGTLVHYYDFANDETTGGATGLLPYSRMKTTPGTSFAVGTLRCFRLHKNYFTELERLNPDLIQRLIGYMTERAKAFATTQLQYEKVNALGKLSAGIAHELNNPASAITRISAELSRRLKENYGLTEKLVHYNIGDENLRSIRSTVEEREKEYATKKKPGLMQRMKKEDEINDWLEQSGLQDQILPGETFAEAGFTGDDLQSMQNGAGKEAFIQVLHWVENLLSSQKLIKDLEDASTRISNLVGAIKSHVHMDQTNDLQPTDLHNDIENTLTLLGYKLREKNIMVKKTFCVNLPEILTANMSAYLVNEITHTPNIEVLPNSELVEACGHTYLEKLVVNNMQTQEKTEYNAAALYVFIGAKPYTDWIHLDIIKNSKEFIETGRNLITYNAFPKIWKLKRDPLLLETSCPGIFAAGDVRAGAMNRVASTVGEGSMSISFVHKYLAEV